MSLSELKQSMTQLPDVEKGNLAAWLLDALPPHSSEDASSESLDEAVRRREQLDSGQIKPLAADEFWAAIERERASWK